MTEEEKKWKLGVSVGYKGDKIDTSMTITDNIDENQELRIKVSKDSVYANYELKF